MAQYRIPAILSASELVQRDELWAEPFEFQNFLDQLNNTLIITTKCQQYLRLGAESNFTVSQREVLKKLAFDNGYNLMTDGINVYLEWGNIKPQRIDGPYFEW